MHTEITESGRFERLVTVHLDEAELDTAKTQAARKLSREMKIKGFRPGKAPRQVVERLVGRERLRSEAIDEALPRLLGDALVEAEITPATRPLLEAVRDGEEGGVDVDVRVTLWPVLDSAPDYHDRKITVEVPEIAESEIDDQLDRIRSQYADLEAVQREGDTGDFVKINLSASRNGVAVDDASADDLLYEIGSASFIDGLDDLLVGVSVGDIRRGPAMLPDGFGDDGDREVEVQVLVKEILAKKLPDVTDEWVSDVSEFETRDELVDALRDGLQARAKSVAAMAYQDGLLDELTDEMDLDLPEALVDAEMQDNLHTLVHRLEQQGLDLGVYLQVTGQDEAAFADEVRQRAAKTLRTRILLEAVAAEESVEVTDDELAGAVASLAEQAQRPTDEVAAALVESGQGHALAGDILRRKALERLLDAATPVDGDGNPVDLRPPAAEESSEEETAAPPSDPQEPVGGDETAVDAVVEDEQ